MPGTFTGSSGNDQKLSGFSTLIGNNGNDELAQGESANGLIQGNNGDDILYFIQVGAGGTIQGGEGNDYIDGINLDDHLYGDAGNDRVSGFVGKDDLYGGDGPDLLDGGNDDDHIFGGNDDDNVNQPIQYPFVFHPTGAPTFISTFAGLYGSDGNDYVDGGDGNDSVYGGDGVDVLVGGKGSDELVGGNDGDIFRYFSSKESKRGASKADYLSDFEVGSDIIDLREMDANTKKDGRQGFKFIGKKDFHHKAGELHYQKGIASADVNGDGKADFELRFHNKPDIGFGDFNL